MTALKYRIKQLEGQLGGVWLPHMGSFNSTCIISGMPLQEGDPIRILLLTESSGSRASRACNMGDWWTPRALPLKGVYDDYGRAEQVEEGLARDLWVSVLKQDVVEKGVGDNQFHDLAVNADMGFDEFLEALWEGRLEVYETGRRPSEKTPHPKTQRVSFAMIREDVWQSMLKLPILREWGPPTPLDISVETYRADLVQEYQAAVEHIRKCDELQREVQGIKESGCDYEDVAALVDVLMMTQSLNRTTPHIASLWSDISSGAFVNIATHWKAAVESHASLEDVSDLIDSAAELSYISNLLYGIRFMWRPTSTAGSQVGNFRHHEAFFEAMRDIAKRQAEFCDEEYGE